MARIHICVHVCYTCVCMCVWRNNSLMYPIYVSHFSSVWISYDCEIHTRYKKGMYKIIIGESEKEST